jgi:lipopolysaccharide export system permease protein
MSQFIRLLLPNRLSWYILRAHIGPFLFGTLTVVFIFLLQYLVNYLDRLVGKGLGFWVITQLIALNLAAMVTLAIPLGVLISALMAFGNLSASNEITIMKSGGTSVVAMMRPVMMCGIALSFFLFWFSDRVLPEANHQSKILWTDIQRKKPTFIVNKGQFSTELMGYRILSRSIDSVAGSMQGMTIYDHVKSDRMSVLSADSGYISFSTDFSRMILTLFHGEIHQISMINPSDYRTILYERHEIVLPANEFSLQHSEESVFSRGDREMNIASMRLQVAQSQSFADSAKTRFGKYLTIHANAIAGKRDTTTPNMYAGSTINQDTLSPQERMSQAAYRTESMISTLRTNLETESYQEQSFRNSANKYLVEIYKKYAMAGACFIFVLVGCPLGIITRRGNVGISSFITLGCYAVYWACLMGGERFADRGLLSPWLGMWMANILLGLMGLFFTYRASKESVPFEKWITRYYLLRHQWKQRSESRKAESKPTPTQTATQANA